MTDPLGSFKQFEHDGWQRVANLYTSVWASLTSQFVLPLLTTADVGKDMAVLDVACGPGLLANEASLLGANAVGMDFSHEMIAAARAAYRNLVFIDGDAENLPFQPESFDRVLVNFGVLHFAHPERAFTEARRVLRRGGILGFTVWAKPEENPGARIVSEALQKHADMDVPLPEGPPYYRFSDPRECRSVLQAAGFDESTLKFGTHTVRWLVPTKRFLFDAERNAGVRSGGILAHQSPERLQAICAAIEERVEQYATGSGFSIPKTAHIITAARKH